MRLGVILCHRDARNYVRTALISARPVVEKWLIEESSI